MSSVNKAFRSFISACFLWLLPTSVALSHPEDPREAIMAYENNTEGYDTGPSSASVHCILVHGFAGSPLDFSELPERLADAGLRVSVLRLPHHGTSASTLAQATPTELISTVESAVSESRDRYETTILVGFSMGGSIATIVAASTKLPKLVLIAPFFEVTHRWYFGLRAETWHATIGSIIPYIPKTRYSVQVNRRAAVSGLFSNRWLPSSAISTLVALGREAGDESTLSEVESELLVLHSPKDMAASPEASFNNFSRFGSEVREYIEMPIRNNHHILSDWDRELAYEHILGFILGQD